MNNIKKKAVSSKNYVVRNRAKIATAATLAVCVAVHIKVIANVNERLEEMGVNLDEFYTPEED